MTVTMHDVQWTQQDVPGNSLEEVGTHIAQMDEAGHTHWHSSYQVTRWEGNTIAEAQVDVQVTVTMPHWAAASSAPVAEQAEWERFLEALTRHEQGHVDLARSYLENADSLLQGGDEHSAAQQWQDNLQNLQTASDQYDTGNNHGENEGTVINMP